jgi:hypothetical protein
MQDMAVWKSKIVELRAMVEAANMGWLVVFNSPAGQEIMSIPEISDMVVRQMDMIAWNNAKYPGHIIDMRASMADPNNINFFVPEYSLDYSHYTQAGNIKWATDVKPLFEARLTQKFGYTL